MASDQLKNEYLYLSDDNNFPKKENKQDRGRRFEKWIKQLLEEERLEPHITFRPGGEELDGSFIHASRVYLLEAKWHTGKMPASSIYQFKGKVDGKLIGTIGVYISMSGFSGEAVDALTFGKSVNIILFDKEDIDYCVETENGFSALLLRKLRVATERGLVYYNAKSLSIDSFHSRTNKIEIIEEKTDTLPVQTTNENVTNVADIAFIVEGQVDKLIISTLAKQILQQVNKEKKISILVAGGKYAVAELGKLSREFYPLLTKIVLVADSDGDIEQTRLLIEKDMENLEFDLITPHPDIESWIARTHGELNQMGPLARGYLIGELLKTVDVNALRFRDTSFNMFFELLTS